MAVKVTNQVASFQTDDKKVVLDADSAFTGGYNNVTLPTLKNVVSSPLNTYEFGQAIAIGDGKVVIGGPSGLTEDESGYAFLYDYEGNYGLSLFRSGIEGGSSGPPQKAPSEFGRHVAIGYGRIVVSEHQDYGVNSRITGAIHLYDTDGTFIKKIIHPDPPVDISNGAAFGDTVAIAGGRIYATVANDGGPQDQYGTTGGGHMSVYVFDLDGNYLTRFYILGSDSLSSRTPAVSHNRIVYPVTVNSTGLPVGYPLSAGNYVHIFDLSGVLINSVVLADQPLTNTNASGAWGNSVSMGNGILAVGSYIFTVDGGPSQEGIVACFDYDGNFQFVLRDPTPSTLGKFGFSVGVGNGRIYVSKESTTPIFMFDLEGNYLGILDNQNVVSPADGQTYSATNSYMSYNAFACADDLLIIGDPMFPGNTDKGQVFFYTVPHIKDAVNNLDQEYKRKPLTTYGNIIEIPTLSGGGMKIVSASSGQVGWEFKALGTVWKKDLSTYTQIIGDWCNVNPPNGTYYIRFTRTGGNDNPNIGDSLATWHSLSSDREFKWQLGGNADMLSAVILVEISDDSNGSNILASASYIFNVDTGQ